MPQKNKKACQAVAQHALETSIFDAGFTDTIDEYINNPSYNTSEEEQVSNEAVKKAKQLQNEVFEMYVLQMQIFLFIQT